MRKKDSATRADLRSSGGRGLAYLPIALLFAVPGIVLGQPPPACGVKCGSDRWTLKTLNDVDVQNVDVTNIQKKTVAQLIALSKPNKRPKLNRVSPTELQTFEV